MGADESKVSVTSATTGRKLRRALGLALTCALATAAGASAQTGGTPPPGGTEPAPPPAPAPTTGVATLQPDGTALAPSDAPRQVRKAINAGNRIRTKPYLWGGGHRKFKAKGYDCSGAVSYLLHAAGMLRRPLSSGPLASSWGAPGIGSWITVYANRSHTYVVVAGLRYDTSAVGESLNQGSGPRWRSTARSSAGYTAKYYPGF
jgi:cell wall-associated NlpC family hydrolase